MSASEINQKVFTVLLAATDISDANVVPEFGNRPIPTGLFMTYDLVLNRSGNPVEADPAASGVRLIYQNWLIEVSLNFYRAGAKNAAYSFIENMAKDSTQLVMLTQQVSSLGGYQVQDLTALEETEFEERAALTFTMLAQTTIQETISYIETLEGSITLDGHNIRPL